jgi:glutamate-ammonia-ligase adenylyltransferase
MMDVELAAQTGALLSGVAARDVPGGLNGAVAAGWLDVAESGQLIEAYGLFWSVQAATRLLSMHPLDTGDLGEGGAAFLCRSTGFSDLAVLETRLLELYDACAVLIDDAVTRGQ